MVTYGVAICRKRTTYCWCKTVKDALSLIQCATGEACINGTKFHYNCAGLDPYSEDLKGKL